ncbi:MAG: N-acetylmuramoyl-L-alanine amidase [Clostridiales bacterium]|nr:N-acetylmuramoyl-L-alanine amidase [Clostridiales bacterium]
MTMNRPAPADRRIDNTNKQNQKASGKKKETSFFRRFILFLLVAALGLGILTGSLYYLDQKGDLSFLQDRFSSGNSSKKKTGSYFKKNKDSSRDGEEENDENSTGGYLLAKGSGDGDLSGYTIILDPGHGGRDTGCCYPFNNPDYYECEFNLRIANEIKDELVDRGATVYLLRTDNSWISLYNRLAQVHLICLDIAEEEGKLPFSSSRADELRDLLQVCIDVNEDTVASGGMGIMVGSGVGEDLEDLMEMEYKLDNVLFLSVHMNSSESMSLHGTQIYYVTDDSIIESEHRQMSTNSEFQRSDFPLRDDYYGRNNEDNYLLACCLYDNIVGNLPELETNGHPTNEDNYAVLREHGLTGALIEVAFLTDSDDRNLLLSDSNVSVVANSVCDGVEMYYKNK